LPVLSKGSGGSVRVCGVAFVVNASRSRVSSIDLDEIAAAPDSAERSLVIAEIPPEQSLGE
jgi:hypothetical protein